ncbi:MAG: hypothetical protein ACI814_003392 [Mariniblastus sp.]|jgi:hypothetical protein
MEFDVEPCAGQLKEILKFRPRFYEDLNDGTLSCELRLTKARQMTQNGLPALIKSTSPDLTGLLI